MERLTTDIYNENTIEHLHRYAMLDNIVKGKIVLDVASGEGYGTNLLSKNADLVIGVDIDVRSIQDATLKYKSSKLIFKQGDIGSLPFPDSYFDIVVCFETIEHVEDYLAALNEIKRVLKSEGILVISTPDKKWYTDARNHYNQYHKKEFYEKEFQLLLNKFFKETILLHQYLDYGSVIQNNNQYGIERRLTADYNNLVSISEHTPMYLIMVCSNTPISDFSTSFFSFQSLKEVLLNKLVFESRDKEYVLIKRTSFAYRIIKILRFLKSLV
jgi:ubiquinone/menaquinone biosynthesis C-methylase UbiE